MYSKSLKLTSRNKVLLLVVDDWLDPLENLHWLKSPVMKPFDQSGSYQRMNPKRSHDPENEAKFWNCFLSFDDKS